MALSDLVPKAVSIDTPHGALKLRPLTLEDLAILSRDYLDEMAGVVDGDHNVAALVSRSPRFVATLIALAAGEPEQVDLAMALPVGVQLKAVETLWSISVLDAEEMANFIHRLLEGVTLMSQQVVGAAD